MCLHTVKWFNSSIWPIDGTLTGVTTQSLSGPGSNGNEEVLHIPQSSRTEDSPSDGLMSYQGHLLVGSYLFAEMQSMYSISQADWASLCVIIYFCM